MKKLHDGTAVSLDTPTKMIGGQRHLMTQDEINQLNSDQEQKVSERITQEIKRYRLEREYGGFYFDGFFIETDEKSERRVIGAWTKAKADPNYTVDDWKTSQGFIDLSNAQLIAIGDAFDEHVQKCFSAEKTVTEAHAQTPYTSIEAVQEAFDDAYND